MTSPEQNCALPDHHSNYSKSDNFYLALSGIALTEIHSTILQFLQFEGSSQIESHNEQAFTVPAYLSASVDVQILLTDAFTIQYLT